MKKEKPATEKKQFDFTPRLRHHYKTLVALQKSLEKLSNPRWFFQKSVSVEDIVFLSREVGRSRADFWTEAINVYPEIDRKDASANEFGITINQ